MAASKEKMVKHVMEELENPYLRESGVYLSVSKGLHKMGKQELSNLYCMLLAKRNNTDKLE